MSQDSWFLCVPQGFLKVYASERTLSLVVLAFLASHCHKTFARPSLGRRQKSLLALMILLCLRFSKWPCAQVMKGMRQMTPVTN